MKIFIWEYVEDLTGHYHSDGGAVVIAENLERALELLNSNGDRRGSDTPFSDLPKIDKLPDMTMDINGDSQERVMIFPDKGCC